MSKYDISIIVPIYNAEKYLNQCIDSILNQTKDKIEVVLVNDGSTDSSPDIIHQYSENHPNIVVVDQENSGVAAARVAGLKHATSQYIGWVDADDFIDPRMYEKLYDLIVKQNADYVYCDYEFYPHKVAGKEKWFKQYYGKVDWNFLERNTQAWRTLTSRALLDEIRIIDLYPAFEEYSWLSVLINAKKIEVLNEKLYFYRVGMESLSGGSYRGSGGSYKGKVKKFRHQVEITRDLDQLIKNTKYETSLKKYFEYRYIYTLLQLLIVSAINNDNEQYKFGRKELKAVAYKENPLTKTILDTNHGKLKSFVLRNLIPLSFSIARVIVNIVY